MLAKIYVFALRRFFNEEGIKEKQMEGKMDYVPK
jgi:hypothetical protein